MTILLLNGPNLNLLGNREPDKYGDKTLLDIENILIKQAKENNFQLKTFQSNHEGALIDFIHNNGESSSAMIFNPGAFTHSSIALRDAILAVKLPFIEVHMSNVYKREAFRHHSYFKDISIGQIIGLGAKGYELALEYLIENLEKGSLL